MDLMILRHGKSSWSHPELDDYDRPLKGRGRRDAAKMGRFIREQQLLPDCILSSPAKRAAQTISLAIEVMGLDPSMIEWHEALYHAEAQDWLAFLRLRPPGTSRLLIMGHNPGLENLLRYFCAERPAPPDGKLLPTAALAEVHLPTDWAFQEQGCGVLLRLTRPRSLN